MAKKPRRQRPPQPDADPLGRPSRSFPIGTVAYYGPDDRTTTKIVAGVFRSPDSEPILRRWMATGVLTNVRVKQELHEFFRSHQVGEVVISDGNMGCPHEEGEDFAVGADCPFCPFWKGKQGSNCRPL